MDDPSYESYVSDYDRMYGDTTPDSNERLLAAAAHISGFFGFGPIIPIVIFAIKGDESRFIRFQAAQAAAFEVVLWIGGFGLGLLAALIGMATMFLGDVADAGPPVAIIALWCSVALVTLVTIVVRIIAAFRTWSGDHFRYPWLGHRVERLLEKSYPAPSAETVDSTPNQ